MTGPSDEVRREVGDAVRRAVVLGATGHLGNAIVRELLARGWAVRAASRAPTGARNLAGLAVELSPGDADVPEQLEGWVRGADLVVDAASPYAVGGREAIAHAVDRTRHLLAAAEREGAVLLHISSFATLPRRYTGFEGLSDRLPRWLHPYFELKQRTEEAVLEAAQNGLRAAVVNPTMCLGPWDQKPVELCFLPQVVLGRMPGFLDHVLNLIDVRDVARGAVAAVEQQRFGEPILLCGHNLPMGDLFHWICEIAELPRPRWSVPTSLGVLGSFVQDALFERRPGGRAVLATLLVAQHRALFPTALQRELGVSLRPLSASLRDALAWYRAIGYC